MDWIALLQWPAMVATIAASWLVASERAGRRRAGFWVFLLSNALWVAWGVDDGAIALVLLQVALALMNVRGARKARRAEQNAGSTEGGSRDGAAAPEVRQAGSGQPAPPAQA